MNPIDFCFWLQGYFELQNQPGPLSAKQAEVMKNHLNLVFAHHIDPLRDSQTTTSVDVLEQTHEGTTHLTEADLGPTFEGGFVHFPHKPGELIKC